MFDLKELGEFVDGKLASKLGEYSTHADVEGIVSSSLVEKTRELSRKFGLREVSGGYVYERDKATDQECAERTATEEVALLSKPFAVAVVLCERRGVDAAEKLKLLGFTAAMATMTARQEQSTSSFAMWYGTPTETDICTVSYIVVRRFLKYESVFRVVSDMLQRSCSNTRIMHC